MWLATGVIVESSTIRQIGNVSLRWIDNDDAVQEVIAAIGNKSGDIFAFCNMHTFNIAQRSASYADALARSTVFNDGVAMDVASRLILGSSFPANLNGTDFTPRVLASLPQGTRVYLLGSAPGVAEHAGHILADRYPGIIIAGADHGFFKDADEQAVLARIKDANADLLLVGMGNPRQEIWAKRYGPETGAVTMCIGAFLDFTAGQVARAPRWMRKVRLEWAYRLMQEPRRMAGRYLLGAPIFLSAVLIAYRRRWGAGLF